MLEVYLRKQDGSHVDPFRDRQERVQVTDSQAIELYYMQKNLDGWLLCTEKSLFNQSAARATFL